MDNIIKHVPLHIQAYNILKGNIMEGGFEPGERIIESKIANQLGISRGPIREAIRMLIQDGLLIQGENSVFVYNPTIQDVIDIFQCRESLEVLAVTLSIAKMNETQHQQLKENIELTTKALMESNIEKLNALDQSFHDLITHASNNKQLIQLMELIKNKVFYMRRNILKSNLNHSRLIVSHERLCRAIIDGDAKAAEQIMRDHIRNSLEDLLRVMKNES